MAEATTKTFKPFEGSGPLKLDHVELHRAFESDKSGQTSIHVWITARATPSEDSFVSLTADIAFELLSDDEVLGVCASPALTFNKPDPAAVRADSGIRIARNSEVKKLKARMDVVKVLHMTAEHVLDPS